MNVYAEQIVFENLIINYIILYATKMFTKSNTSKIRLFIASAIGSAYTLVAFFPSIAFMLKFISKVVVAIIIVQVGFKPKKLNLFIKLMATFHLIAFAFAGICLALLYTTQVDRYISNGIFYISNFKIKKLMISIVFGIILFQLAMEYIQNKNKIIENLLSVNINFKDKEVNVMGMIDTGNSLIDPINRLPVIVAEFSAIRELFPESIQEAFKMYTESNIELFTNVLCNGSEDFKFRLIPFKSLGNSEGMLLGFKPDKVTLKDKDSIEVSNLIIGIYNNKLSNEDEYNALLHPDIIT